ncbi:MAG: PEGA domain-containing protein [Nitrosomonas sp.]|nr:MAG: PEGA domain-containing protein [Nitrosomonas sp.]
MSTENCKKIIIAAALIALSGCATIMGNSAPETLNVRSTPDQARVVITDESGKKIFEGRTPTSLSLEKKKAYFSGKKYDVKIQKEGYEEQAVTIDTKVNGWYVGNILFGGIIGLLIVDPATGAMWTLDTNEVNVSFNTPKQSELMETGSAKIVLLQDIPPSLKNKMIRISQP